MIISGRSNRSLAIQKNFAKMNFNQESQMRQTPEEIRNERLPFLEQLMTMQYVNSEKELMELSEEEFLFYVSSVAPQNFPESVENYSFAGFDVEEPTLLQRIEAIKSKLKKDQKVPIAQSIQKGKQQFYNFLNFYNEEKKKFDHIFKM